MSLFNLNWRAHACQLETNMHNVEHKHSSTRIQFEMLEAKRDTDGRPRQRPQWQWNRLSAAAAVAAVLACAAAILFAMQIRGVEVGHAHAIEASLEHKLAAMEVRLEQQSEQQLIIKAVSSLIQPNVFSANDVRLAQQSEKIIKAVIATNLTHIVEQAKTQELQTRRQRDNHNTRGQAETAIPVDRRKIDQTADLPRLGDGPSRQAKPQARLRHGNFTGRRGSSTTSAEFDKIYQSRYWVSGREGAESHSGPGSTVADTAKVRVCVAAWLKKYHIETLGDICGDFNWQHKIEGINSSNYFGFDTSALALKRASNKHPSFNFQLLDLVDKIPPKTDAFMVREVLQHLPLRMSVKLIQNVLESGVRFIILSTFPKGTNMEIRIGQYYENNLSKEPFKSILPNSSPLETCSLYTHRNNGQLWLLDARR